MSEGYSVNKCDLLPGLLVDVYLVKRYHDPMEGLVVLKYSISVVAVALFLHFFTGCSIGVSPEYLQSRAARHIDCASSEISTTLTTPNDGFGNFVWLAQCRGREYRCQQRGGGNGPAIITCQETESSQVRTASVVAADRLALETSCPRDQIRLVEQGEWTRGGETAYRFEACGGTYVCSSGPGGTDCEVAQQAPASAASSPAASQANDSRLSREEVIGVIGSAEAEARACIGDDPPPQVSIRFQVNGDGSAIYLGTEPDAPAEAAGCLRRLIGELRFRATGGEPFTVNSPPLVFHQPASDGVNDGGADSEPDSGP